MSNTNTCTATRHGYACVHPAGHSGRHLNHRGPWRDPAPECNGCSPVFRNGEWVHNPRRERWKLVGREGGTIYSPPYYVYQLENPDGTVNSSWLVPVSDLLGGKL